MKVLLAALFCCLALTAPPVAAGDVAVPEYRLAVSIDPDAGRLVGTATLRLERASTVTMGLGGLRVTAIFLDGKKQTIPAKGDELRLRARKTVEIAYEKRFAAGGEDHIDRDEVILTDGWYPSIDGPARYTIEAVFPRGWYAIAEGETWTSEELGAVTRHRFDFPHPITDGVTLAASPHYAISTRRHGDISLETWLMPGFAASADIYLDRMAALVDDYQGKFGPYPHRRLSLVEANIPSSLSLPGFVLMNRSALGEAPRLPTLAHELVHEWFGNAAYIAYGAGNWAEGAAIYFGDHYLDELDGKGWRCRKRMLIGYHNRVSGREEIPLARFAGREDDMTRWVGYGKGALVFHALRGEIGETAFFGAVRDFLARHRYRTATWDDLRASAERISGRKLGWLFEQWIARTGLPRLAVEAELTTQANGRGQYLLHLTVRQQAPIFRLGLPVRIAMPGGAVRDRLWIDDAEQRYEFLLDAAPTALVIDEDYDVPRILADAERYPTIEQLQSADALTLVMPKDGSGAYAPVAGHLDRAGRLAATREPRLEFPRRQTNFPQARRATPDVRRGTPRTTRPSAVLALGVSNPALARLAGADARFVARDDGACLEVFLQPGDPSRFVAVLDSHTAADSEAMLDRLDEFSGFSRLCLTQQGLVVEKAVAAHPRGWEVRIPAPNRVVR
jgi:hypothetical protein